MAIVTDQTITIHGVQVGISKPIQTLIAEGDFTYEELSKFAFAGRHDFVNDVCGIYDSEATSYGQSSYLESLEKYPVLNDPTKSWDTIWYMYHGSVGRHHDTYGKIVLVYNMSNTDNSIKVNYNDNNQACIVTELNPKLLKMMPNIYQSTITATLGEPGIYTTYDVETSMSINWYDDNSGTPFRTLCVSKFNNMSYFFFPLYNNTLRAAQNISGNTNGTYAQLLNLQDSFSNQQNAYLSPWASSDAIQDFMEGHDYGATWTGANKLDNDRADRLLVLDYRGAWDFAGNVSIKPRSFDTALKQCAACGLYFEYNNIVYKPISSGGVVTGYTSDLTKNSEWDLINGVTGNNVPDSPPGPPTPGASDIYIGNTNISSIYLGDNPVSKIYLGDQEIYS